MRFSSQVTLEFTRIVPRRRSWKSQRVAWTLSSPSAANRKTPFLTRTYRSKDGTHLTYTRRHASACRFVLIAGRATPPSPGAGGYTCFPEEPIAQKFSRYAGKASLFLNLRWNSLTLRWTTYFAVTMQKAIVFVVVMQLCPCSWLRFTLFSRFYFMLRCERHIYRQRARKTLSESEFASDCRNRKHKLQNSQPSFPNLAVQTSEIGRVGGTRYVTLDPIDENMRKEYAMTPPPPANDTVIICGATPYDRPTLS
jgi:hypothetical protein